MKMTIQYNETRVQENFSFRHRMITSLQQKILIKYKLPSIDFLKTPSKKDKNLSENKIDEKTLEKDFT